MERKFNISGAYDGTSHPRNYGIGAMQIYFSIKGDKGGVSCMFGTSWYLPQNQLTMYEMYTKGYPFDPLHELMQPKGHDISFHSKERLYDFDDGRPDCDLTDGHCYSDGSSLNAQDFWLPIFLHEGSEGIYSRLEQEYEYRFNGGEPPDLTPKPKEFPT